MEQNQTNVHSIVEENFRVIDNRHGRKRTLPDVICTNCKILFRPLSRHQTFCGNKCRLSFLHENGRRKGKFFGNTAWSSDEDRILQELYPDPNNSLSEISKIMNRSIRAIEHRLNELGIKRNFTTNDGEWSEERRRWYSENRTGERNSFYGKQHTEETIKKLSAAARKSCRFSELAKDPAFQKKRMAALYTKPNKEEKKLDAIIQEACPEEYEYVGNGKVFIDGLNPDWIHKNKKLIIELFGRSFHDVKTCAWEVPERSTVEGRTKAFLAFEYKILIVWDSDLTKSKRKTLIDMIKGFTYKDHNREMYLP